MKVCVVGDMRVGKSSLLNRLVKGFYDDDALYQKTITSTFAMSTSTENNKNKPITLYDLGGDRTLDKFHANSIFPSSDLFLICACDYESFHNVSEKWVKNVKRIVPGAPIILLLTKSDNGNLPIEELISLGHKVGAINAISTSAKEGGESLDNLKEMLIDFQKHPEKLFICSLPPLAEKKIGKNTDKNQQDNDRSSSILTIDTENSHVARSEDLQTPPDKALPLFSMPDIFQYHNLNRNDAENSSMATADYSSNRGLDEGINVIPNADDEQELSNNESTKQSTKAENVTSSTEDHVPLFEPAIVESDVYRGVFMDVSLDKPLPPIQPMEKSLGDAGRLQHGSGALDETLNVGNSARTIDTVDTTPSEQGGTFNNYIPLDQVNGEIQSLASSRSETISTSGAKDSPVDSLGVTPLPIQEKVELEANGKDQTQSASLKMLKSPEPLSNAVPTSTTGSSSVKRGDRKWSIVTADTQDNNEGGAGDSSTLPTRQTSRRSVSFQLPEGEELNIPERYSTSCRRNSGSITTTRSRVEGSRSGKVQMTDEEADEYFEMIFCCCGFGRRLFGQKRF